ncbi:arsenate reductase (glutaredoxin) [Gordonia desulfuricans]|uniref:arsenate reductase (glutathione/glutaredoxin) n=1 Tax=Gordonia desulfuricans TaxID=89051 RepID=A0A7K3LM00_9ACTN|nr:MULTISPECIES: arsenate reductase (glutaredoxin) [Gordonia]EMP12322.1 arsenate reductase [Gordonia sp. NB41Y]NDK89274.1 arsenate reductase (glutaredoxin) [Gordonia desulfuricans]WLP91786.1 arsenate reductase (glutaredoxin) [Gordonia sp. NB41Y]
MDATIYHNPRCSTSRKALQALRDAGVEPTIVKYLDEPYTRERLVELFADAGLTPKQAVRKREALYAELGLAEASDDEILDAMVQHPILVERPIVVTDKGTRIPRPFEKLDEIL